MRERRTDGRSGETRDETGRAGEASARREALYLTSCPPRAAHQFSSQGHVATPCVSLEIAKIVVFVVVGNIVVVARGRWGIEIAETIIIIIVVIIIIVGLTCLHTKSKRRI